MTGYCQYLSDRPAEKRRGHTAGECRVNCTSNNSARAGGAQPAPTVADIERATIELTPAGRGLSDLRRRFSLSLQILMGWSGSAGCSLCQCSQSVCWRVRRPAERVRGAAGLGAGRFALDPSLLTESVLLVALGGWPELSGLVGQPRARPNGFRRFGNTPSRVTPNVRVLGFTLLTSLLSAIIFGTARRFVR